MCKFPHRPEHAATTLGRTDSPEVGHVKPNREIAMSILQRTLTTALTVLAFGVLGASAGQQLPQYEVTGFPISPLQMSVVRSGGIQEEPPAPGLTIDGMPASPHQITVIRGQQIAHKLKTDGP